MQQPPTEPFEPLALRLFEKSVWSRLFPLRWFYRWMINRGSWYVVFRGDAEQIWTEGMRHAPISFRWLGRTLKIADLDGELDGWTDWMELKERIQHGDKIWPFVINPWTLAMRGGYVVLRRGQLVGGIITVVS